MNVNSRYYYAGTTRIAMRKGSNTLNFLLGDHSLVPRDRLGSTAITTDSSGVKTGEIRYYPWGTERYNYGSTPTNYHFTGQRLESGLGYTFITLVGTTLILTAGYSLIRLYQAEIRITPL